MARKTYPLVYRNPFARFYYKSPSHSHPVVREVLITENRGNLLTGYELRSGAVSRPFDRAPIKSYRKDRIATYSELRKEVRDRMPKSKLQETTLVRM